jgi:hypothetical protein
MIGVCQQPGTVRARGFRRHLTTRNPICFHFKTRSGGAARGLGQQRVSLCPNSAWPRFRHGRLGTLIWAGAVLLLLASTPAWAIPSFARQTGLPCSRCHTAFPELTSFGREFKLNGYTLSGEKTAKVTAPPEATPGLWLNENLPLSAMFQISDTSTAKAVPGTQNRNLEFPQQLSIFLAGELGPRVGAFMQVTYSAVSDHLSMDNTDIRFTNMKYVGGKPLVYGFDVNNNPTVEDLWNDTPAWGYPFASPDSAPSPYVRTIIDGPLAQDVGGVGAYAMYNHHFYGDVTAYRSMHIGGPQPPTGTGYGTNIDGVAPYWRGAYQTMWGRGANYLEVGTFGIHLDSFPATIAGARDRYLDNALDAQYERRIGANTLSLHAVGIHENSELNGTMLAGGASVSKHDLNTLRFNALYHFSRYVVGGGPFKTTGTSDALLYPPNQPIVGCENGDPRNGGYTLTGADYMLQNVELSFNYIGYGKFNGGTTNYDGNGRNARQNNTGYVNLWLMF